MRSILSRLRLRWLLARRSLRSGVDFVDIVYRIYLNHNKIIQNQYKMTQNHSKIIQNWRKITQNHNKIIQNRRKMTQNRS